MVSYKGCDAIENIPGLHRSVVSKITILKRLSGRSSLNVTQYTSILYIKSLAPPEHVAQYFCSKLYIKIS